MNFWEHMTTFHEGAARRNPGAEGGPNAVAFIRKFYETRFGKDSIPPRPLANYLRWASSEQAKRLELLARELRLATMLPHSTTKVARLGVEAEFPAAMAEIEVAAAVFAAGGTVEFMKEGRARSADLLIGLQGETFSVEVTSLRESQEHTRADQVHDRLFPLLIRGVWHGGVIHRAPTHAELKAFETELEVAVGRLHALQQTQHLLIGDWLDVYLWKEGAVPVPEGLGTLDVKLRNRQPLDILMARKITEKAPQLQASGNRGYVVVVDDANQWGNLSGFMEDDLAQTAAALLRAPIVRGLLYATPPLRGVMDSELRVETSERKKMYHLRPRKISLGSVGTICTTVADEAGLAILVDAIINLEERVDALPSLGFA